MNDEVDEGDLILAWNHLPIKEDYDYETNIVDFLLADFKPYETLLLKVSK